MTPIIPDWYYRARRRSYEHSMRSAAEPLQARLAAAASGASPAVHPGLVASTVAALVMFAGAFLLGGDLDDTDEEAGRDGHDTFTLRAVLLDTLADAAAAAGVAMTGAVILTVHGWYWLDPAVALTISVVITYHAGATAAAGAPLTDRTESDGAPAPAARRRRHGLAVPPGPPRRPPWPPAGQLPTPTGRALPDTSISSPPGPRPRRR
jgi:Cation efflux family